MNTGLRAHVGLLGANLLFAINISVIKYLTAHHFIEPFGLNLVRVGGCVILFWLLYFMYPYKNKIAKKDILRFILCALTGIAVNQMLFVKGLSLTYSIHAVLLMLTTPILITVIAAWLLKEKITFYKITGLVLGISGAVILISSGANTGTGSNILWGDILVMINAVSYTFYFILVKPLMQQYDPVQIIRWIFTIGLFMVLPFAWKEFIQTGWQAYGPIEYSSLVFIVIGGTFLPYLFNVYGIKILGASISGAYMYSQPVFVAIIASIFLQEKLDLYKIMAAALIFTGVYLSNKKEKGS